MKQPDFTPTIMTAEEVSTLLRIPLATVYLLSKQGRLRGIKIGKHWRYLASDIYQSFQTPNSKEPVHGISI